MKVKEVMTADKVKYCSPSTKLQVAAGIMKESNCGALPVVDKEQKVLGIVTDRDICLSLAGKHTTPEDFFKNTVGQIMNEKVHSVQSKDDIETAYHLMRTNKIGRLPVTDKNGKLEGIITLHTILNESVSNRNENFGKLSATNENLSRTIHAVTDRYTGHGRTSEKKTLSM